MSRSTLRDVARHPSWVIEWWMDTPWKRPRNWRTLLFESGRGWLRWRWDIYEQVEPIDAYGRGPSYDVPCAPPLRRLWARATDLPQSWWRYLRQPDKEGWERPEHYRCGDWSWAKDPEWPYGFFLH